MWTIEWRSWDQILFTCFELNILSFFFFRPEEIDHQDKGDKNDAVYCLAVDESELDSNVSDQM
jgi:hypothetical protein